jgi:hypothetical protein
MGTTALICAKIERASISEPRSVRDGLILLSLLQIPGVSQGFSAVEGYCMSLITPSPIIVAADGDNSEPNLDPTIVGFLSGDNAVSATSTPTTDNPSEAT